MEKSQDLMAVLKQPILVSDRTNLYDVGIQISAQNTHTTGHLIEIEGTCQSVVWSGDDWVNDLSDLRPVTMYSFDRSMAVGRIHCRYSTQKSMFIFPDYLKLPMKRPAYYTWSFSPPTGNHLCETPDSSGWTGNCEGGLENKAGRYLIQIILR